MLPEILAARFDVTAWPAPPVFAYLCERGGVAPAERYRVFNMGLGFVLAVAPAEAPAVQAELNRDAGAAARVVGAVEPRPDATAPAVRGLFDDSAG
jgi:phosphoribosylformylglycinamidine cyclo-ligase